MRDWPPCPPIQRNGGRRSRPSVNPFISALTVARCPATFPGVWPQLRDTLSTSRSVGRGTGAFIYALSADETSPALAAPRHAITALFSCCFKCPCPLGRQPHFRSNADRAYNTLHFASKVVCQRDTLWKPRTTKQAEYPALFRCLILSLFCCQQPPFRGLFSPFVKFGVASFVGYIKGKSTLMIFERHANLKYKYGNRHFWCRGYYVDTVGKNAKKIQEYIQNQLKEDLEYDQMTLKEYIDPFTGEPVKQSK